MQTIYMNGTVSLDESDLNRMNYIITSLADKTQTSITDILDTIYNSENTISKLVRVCGRIYDTNHTFNGFESLHISKDKYKTLSYHIGSFPIENQLYELIGCNVEILIEDYTDSIGKFITTTGVTEDITHDTKAS